MINIQKELLKAVKTMITNTITTLKFNYYIEGVIVTDNLDGTYEVNINGEIFTLQARENLTINVPEVYWICVVNGDFNKKYIIEKRLV